MISARAAAELGRGAGRLLVAGCAGEPGAVLDAVAGQPDLWRGVRITGAFIPGVNDRPYGALAPQGSAETIFATTGLRDAPGTAFLPLHYTSFWERLARPGMVDLVYMTVPPPRGGTVGFGACCDFAPAAIAAGARLVGVVNPAMPDVPDGPRLPLDRFEALCEGDGWLPELPEADPDPASLAIAGHVLGLLRPGGTLQLGLGRLQTAILRALQGSGLRGLRYHAGMISGGMEGALSQGVFDEATTGVALGDRGFYARLPDLPLRFAPVGWTHAISTLAAVPGLVSVNSVLQVDLSGQANGEFLGGRQISGHGGMVDFLRGARLSEGGRAVLALPATARGGESRIVPRLDAGVPVSVARADVDLVVTEHGVADLREASLGDRARRLAAIAAPEHRDRLFREAVGLA